MGKYPPFWDEKKFNPLNQPAICFLLLVPIYKRVQNNTTRMHVRKPTILISKIKKISGDGATPHPLGASGASNSTPSASLPSSP